MNPPNNVNRIPATNNTNDARLSVDNGTTFYNIDGCKAIALGGEYLRVVFDGTKFLYMTDLGPSTIEYVFGKISLTFNTLILI